ncbi:MAG: glutamate-1-semialdehyde 2,1-aminomutase [Nitrososphaerota archaeon]
MSSPLLERAKRVLVGGVNSPVRSFKSVGMDPLILSRAEGPYIYDQSGKKYIDLICGWGSIILGHAIREVVEAAVERLQQGHILGLTSELEVELAEEVVRSFSSIENVRFTCSGTEGVMTAVRLARAFTGRKRIMVFEGCYHGHYDSLLTKEARDHDSMLGSPSSQGVPTEVLDNTIVARFNDLDSVKAGLRKYKGEVAAILLEPVPANMGVVRPGEGFLEELRAMADREGCLLVFDEIVTGFRIARGGAQEVYRVESDLTCLGKVLGGGLPIGCVGGRSEVMKLLAPEGRVYHAGTFAGNPLVMAMGLQTLRSLEGQTYKVLEEVGRRVGDALHQLAESVDAGVVLQRVGSMFTLFFTKGKEVRDFRLAISSDLNAFTSFFSKALKAGLLLPPSQFEAAFISLAHSEAVPQIERAVEEVCRLE